MKGVKENTLYILPYPEFCDRLEQIHQTAMAALAKPEDDPTMAACVKRERTAMSRAMRAQQDAGER